MRGKVALRQAKVRLGNGSEFKRLKNRKKESFCRGHFLSLVVIECSSDSDCLISSFEDLRALDGGKHGLDVIEPLLGLARKYLIQGGRLFMEVDPCHAFLVPQLIQDKAAYGLEGLKIQHILKDFRGNDRFIVITKVLS